MRKLLGFLIVFLLGLITVIDLLHPGFAVTHDGQDHIARIANFYLNLQQGVFIPRWAANLNWGYGHPILEFLYPLPSYLASVFHFLGFSFVDSTKTVFAISMVASGIAMYFFVKKIWGEAAGVVSGALYMYAPYRFVDLYVRGDIGEHVAFVFVPLVFLGMYILAKRQTFKNVLFCAVSLALLILAHNAIALMMVPLILFYGFFLWNQFGKNKKIGLSLTTAFFLGFLLSSFFWVPALIEGQYTLRNIVTKGEYISRFVSLGQLLYGTWNYGQTGMFTVQLGILSWVSLFGSIFLAIKIWKKKKQTALMLGGLICATFVAIFLMLPVSNIFWVHIMLLQNFQFPWRFLAIPVFTTALLAGICVSQLSPFTRRVMVVIACLFLLFISKDYMHAKSYAQKPESFFTGTYDSTTDTGESSPIWSVRFMGHRFDTPMQVIAGNAVITQEKRSVVRHEYIVASQGTSRVMENTLYFPGWRVTVDNKPVVVQFQEPQYRGLMTFFVGSGTHTVVVSYQESKLRLFGDVLSVISIICIIGYALIRRKRKK